MDMKSVTDRAAQTLMWTELIRGGPLGEGQMDWGGKAPLVEGEGPTHHAHAAHRTGHDPELPVPGASHHKLPI